MKIQKTKNLITYAEQNHSFALVISSKIVITINTETKEKQQHRHGYI